LFYTRDLSPVTGSIVFLLEGGILIWTVRALRSRTYRRVAPSVKLVLLVCATITLVLAFAGVEPLSSYKDWAIEWTSEKVEDLEWFTSQELGTAFVGFDALRQPPDISRVTFFVSLERTERTVHGTVYVVSLEIDGQASDSEEVVVSESGSMTATVTLVGRGRTMNEMMSGLDRGYAAAKSDYDTFEEKMSWDLLTGRLTSRSYEEIQKLEEKENRLQAEMNKWKAWLGGRPLSGQTDQFDRFIRRYARLSVTRAE